MESQEMNTVFKLAMKISEVLVRLPFFLNGSGQFLLTLFLFLKLFLVPNLTKLLKNARSSNNLGPYVNSNIRSYIQLLTIHHNVDHLHNNRDIEKGEK